jgi:hypothetical protein
MMALTVLNLANNNLGELVLIDGWTKGCVDEYTHADGRKQKEPPGTPEGVIAIANAIKDMRLLSSVNLLNNNLREEGLKVIEEVFEASQTLRSICGAIGPELDLSGQGLCVDDAKVIGIEIMHNVTLLSLNLAKTNLAAEGAKIIAAALTVHKGVFVALLVRLPLY